MSLDPDVHEYVQATGVRVQVCVCGLWPDHHVHTGITRTCTCDECQSMRARTQGWNVTKYASYIQVSDELLMDHGLIPDTRPVFVPTRRTRLRRWASQNVTSFRFRLGSWIAGVDLREMYEDW